MKKPVIALDIDNVLVASEECLTHKVEADFGVKLRAMEERERFMVHEVAELAGVSEKTVWGAVRKFMLAPEFTRLKPMPGAVPALERLSEDFTLVTITSRSPEFVPGTRKWVENTFGRLITAMHFPNAVPLDESFEHVDKNVLLKEIGAIWLVDDSPEHFGQGMRDIGVRGILYGDYPHSRTAVLPEWVVRAGDWDNVTRIILGD